MARKNEVKKFDLRHARFKNKIQAALKNQKKRVQLLELIDKNVPEIYLLKRQHLEAVLARLAILVDIHEEVEGCVVAGELKTFPEIVHDLT